MSLEALLQLYTNPSNQTILVGIACSTVFFVTLQLLCEFFVSIFVKPTILKLHADDGKKFKFHYIDWSNRFVSQVHACILLPWAFYLAFFDPVLVNDKLHGRSALYLINIVWSCGYFVWDLFISTYYYKLYGFEFLFHAVFCLATYTATLFGPSHGLGWFTVMLQLYEASTPFMNARWVFMQYKATGHPLFHVCNLCFAGMFFVSRILLGAFYLVPMIWYYLLAEESKDMTRWQWWWFAFASVSSTCLNFYWMFLIVQAATKKRTPEKKKD